MKLSTDSMYKYTLKMELIKFAVCGGSGCSIIFMAISYEKLSQSGNKYNIVTQQNI